MNTPEEFLKKLEEFCEAEGYYIIVTPAEANLSLITKAEKWPDEHYDFYDVEKNLDFDLMIKGGR